MRSQTAQNITNLDGQVDTRFSETLQNIAANSFDILGLRENVTGLDEDVGSVSSDIMSLTQDVTVRLDNLNSTQVRNDYVFPCLFIRKTDEMSLNKTCILIWHS